ncbi:MAG: calcium/sodium antiporter [Clostridia bacterium]
MIQNIVFIAIGFAMLMLGAKWLVDGSSAIARKYHIPEIVIGLTIVSIGTSMPELMVSFTSALEGHSDISVGNVIGSNLCNLLLILGLTSIVTPLVFSKTTKDYDISIMLFSTIIVLLLANKGNILSRADGILLLVLFIFFILYTIKIAQKSMNNCKENEAEIPKGKMIVSVIKILVGIVLLKFGGDISVNNAVEVAQILGVSERIIGVTIVAIGTSLPELITSIVAAFKKEIDIAIGNIVGSNIFNLLLILGVSATISPIVYSIEYNLDFILLSIASLLLLCFAMFGKKDTMTRFNGLIYLLMYGGYMASLIF